MTKHNCKDCKEKPPKTVRPAPHPGPRCVTHHREFKKGQKARNHERMVQRVYNLPPGHYDALLKFQNGTCAICQRAKGLKRAMAVDHRHSDGQVRGILCQKCNYQLLGQFDIPALQRAIEYLTESPYEQFLKNQEEI